MNIPIIIDLNAASLFAVVAAFIYRYRPPIPLWPTLFIVQILAIVWILGDIGTHLAEDLVSEQAAISVIYAGSYGLIAGWWILAFRFAEVHGVRPAWANPTVVWAPTAFAVLAWLCVTTNSWHGQFLTPVIGAKNEYHWLWWVTAITGYAALTCIAVGYWNLYRIFEKNPGSRRQAKVMLVATLLGLTSNAAYTLIPMDWPLDLSVLGGLLTGVLFVVGIYRGRLFDLSPAAFRELLRGDPTALIIVDRDGHLLYANPSAYSLFGPVKLSPHSLVDGKLRRLLRQPADGASESSLEAIWNEIEDGDYSGAFFLVTGDRRKMNLWITGQGLRGSNSVAPTEAIALRIHDITHIYEHESERHRLEGRLARADRLRSLGSLAAGVAHEVNNPVGSSLLAAEYALEARTSTGDLAERDAIATEALQTVIDQSMRAARITRNMLRFARDGSGGRRLGDIRNVVVQSRDFTRAHAIEHGSVVDVDMDPDLPAIEMNETEMEQVLVNLIHNAILSGKPGRRVGVKVEAVEAMIRITISDDGTGMTHEQCEHAFEPFYSSRSVTVGTGLGLSVVHGIVSDHGGQVWIESELGLGTRIVLELPIPEV